MMQAAMDYNAAKCKSLGWHGKLPHLAWLPDLQLDPLGPADERERFALAVVKYQHENRLDADGKLGPGTWQSMQYYLKDETEPEGLPGFMHDGELLHSAVLCNRKYDFNPGRPGYSNLNTKPTRIIVHWGGIDVDHCAKVLNGNEYFTHFGVGPDGVYQWLDTVHKGTHAGSAGNTQSIGIDICQQPTINYRSKYEGLGYDCSVVPNRAYRPDGQWVGHPDHKNVLTLDSEIALYTNMLIIELCEAYDIPKVWPGNHRLFTQAEAEAYRGVLFHSHLSATKWDIACWTEQIVDGLDVG